MNSKGWFHDLELSNSIEQVEPVKSIDRETASELQLVSFHYYVARGLQERGRVMTRWVSATQLAGPSQHHLRKRVDRPLILPGSTQ